MLSLRLLGRPGLATASGPLNIKTRKSWALLLLLACTGERPRQQLVAQLWPSLDEATARRNLRRELARLREVGAEPLLRVDGDFLALHQSVTVDLHGFEAALRSGQDGAALALWRGPLADGLALDDAPGFDDWLAAERERWRVRWRGALQAQALAAPAAQALLHWQTLLGDDPLQEQVHLALMRLHASAGRRELALAQYEHCKALLRAELGLAPMAETEAEAAALRAAPVVPVAPQARSASAPTPQPAPGFMAAPSMAPATTNTLLPEVLPFVGRADEVAQLELAWHSARTVLVEGQGGVGKSRLVLDFVAAHGPFALARCRPGDGQAPYASFTRALRALAGPTPALAGLPGWVAQELARLLPEVGPEAGPPPIRTDEERSRFFEACTLAWRTWCDGNFDAVVLDDWHHADAASSALLALVVQRRHESTSRDGREFVLMRPGFDTAVDTSNALQLLREGSAALQLHLPPLAPEAVFDLVRQLSGASHPARFAARLQDATAGNPFFLVETLRQLIESSLLAADVDGVWRTPFDEDTQDYRELPIPASVLEAVLARVQRVSEPCRRVLEAASLATEPFYPALLAPACALSELDAVLAIEQAVAAQLLREHEAGGFAFAHDLVQQALDGALSAERRRLVHRRLALGAVAADAPAAVVAAHHEASGETRRAVPYRLSAAEQAQRLHALPEAAQHWRAALADGATASQALQAHQGLMQAARMGCEFEALRTHSAALQALAQAGHGVVLSADERAAALVAVADNLAFDNRAAQALAMLDSLPSHLAGPVQSKGLMVRSRALHALGRIDDARGAAAAALQMHALPGQDQIDLLDTLGWSEIAAGELALARAHADAALGVSRSLGHEDGAARAIFRRGLIMLIEGDLAAAQSELQVAADSLGRCGSVYTQRKALYNLCLVHEARSDHAQALATAQHGWNLQPALQHCDLRVMYRLAFVDAHNALGELGSAWDHAAQAIAEALVLAQDEPFVLLATTNCTLELLGLLGETGVARQLLAATAGEALRELRLASPELWIASAQFEMKQGNPVAARAALDTLAAGGTAIEIPDVRVRARHALAAAELALVEGKAQAALALLPDDNAPGMNDEMRTRSLALRVRALCDSGALDAGTVHRVQDRLAAPSAYALATLELHLAVAQAQMQMQMQTQTQTQVQVPGHGARGVSGLLLSAAGQSAQFVAMLLHSLQAHPAQRAAFEQGWTLEPSRPGC